MSILVFSGHKCPKKHIFTSRFKSAGITCMWPFDLSGNYFTLAFAIGVSDAKEFCNVKCKEPSHEKMDLWACAPCKDSNTPLHLLNLITAFTFSPQIDKTLIGLHRCARWTHTSEDILVIAGLDCGLHFFIREILKHTIFYFESLFFVISLHW